MAKHQVLFCPFCHESFEDIESCPEHELPLIRFEQLRSGGAPDAGPEPDESAPPSVGERALSALDLRHGRGVVGLGALLVGSALALDLARLEGAPMLRTFELARARPSLWTLGLVSFTALYALSRRRTLAGLRGLRVLVPLLGVVALATLAWVLSRLGQVLEWGAGVYVVVLGALALIVGGARLGAARFSKRV